MALQPIIYTSPCRAHQRLSNTGKNARQAVSLSLVFSLSLSLSLFRLLSAYLLPFLLFPFQMIQTTLKCVLLMSSLNLHFLFHGNTEMKRMPSTVKVIVHVLSDKRSKYAIVGTKKNPNKFSDLANSEGHLRNNSILPSPRQSEYFFIPSRVNFLTKYCLRL